MRSYKTFGVRGLTNGHGTQVTGSLAGFRRNRDDYSLCGPSNDRGPSNSYPPVTPQGTVGWSTRGRWGRSRGWGAPPSAGRHVETTTGVSRAPDSATGPTSRPRPRPRPARDVRPKRPSSTPTPGRLSGGGTSDVGPHKFGTTGNMDLHRPRRGDND